MNHRDRVLLGVCLFSLSLPSFAQSAFEGFYGQIATGYENNRVDDGRLTGTDYGGPSNVSTSASPSGSAMPLVVGLGYTMGLNESFTLGFGVDYSVLNQSTDSAGFGYPMTGSTAVYDYKFTVSNRINLFVSPGYVIDQDKLAYIKLGYSNQGVQYQQTNCCSSPSNTASVNGYLLGVGYKQMIRGQAYVLAEANYYAYSSANLSSTYSDGPGGTVSSSPSTRSYNFLIGVGYKF